VLAQGHAHVFAGAAPQARAFSIAMPIASEATTMPRPPSPERAAVAGPSRNTSISGRGLMVRF
jgi:hypothetical protein